MHICAAAWTGADVLGAELMHEWVGGKCGQSSDPGWRGAGRVLVALRYIGSWG